MTSRELSVAEGDDLMLADRLITILVETYQFAGEIIGGMANRSATRRSQYCQ